MAKLLRRTRVISFRLGAYRFHVEKHTWYYPPSKELINGAIRLGKAVRKAGLSLKKGYKAGRK